MDSKDRKGGMRRGIRGADAVRWPLSSASASRNDRFLSPVMHNMLCLCPWDFNGLYLPSAAGNLPGNYQWNREDTEFCFYLQTEGENLLHTLTFNHCSLLSVLEEHGRIFKLEEANQNTSLQKKSIRKASNKVAFRVGYMPLFLYIHIGLW